MRYFEHFFKKIFLRSPQDGALTPKNETLWVYKRYAASVEYSNEDDCLVGHIAGINDVVGFHASSVPELHTAFGGAVDDYLQTCKKTGRPPKNPILAKSCYVFRQSFMHVPLC